MTDDLDILYVEDCEATVELLKLSLNRHCPGAGITLDVASSVADAVEVFDAKRHVAALIDWNLPDGYGVEVAEHIRNAHCTFPIIFVSSLYTDEDLQIAKNYNPRDCLIKDYKERSIANIVRHIPIASRS